ncbi:MULTISPECIES: hypothetical protein [unclassified Devosia]|uniref:hypothetical protein n=1 Tax=unclassified Devosia TaxID=196773 RepID=UPI0015518AAB|nr:MULTISPECIES: hypothetical protein [unclassified Devosia]
MPNQNPRGPAQPIGKAVDDEDPNYSPVADRAPKPAGPRGAAEQADKDNERAQKGAP